MECTSIDDVRQAATAGAPLRIVGGGTKSALSRNGTLATGRLRGMLQYEPSEYTFTAFAGTPLAEIEALLAQHGQFLPFDPPFVEAGATLGGTVAAGLSGPGRLRYGGVRDFLLGVKLVTGEGRVVFGGGKVVKNAAGFDIPKLMVGSLGQFGVLVEMTFKVFPRPESYTTLRIEHLNLTAALETMDQIAGSPFEPASLDLEPPGTLWLRFGGTQDASEKRIARARALVKGAAMPLDKEEDRSHWESAREFRWVPAGHTLYKVSLAPPLVPEAENHVAKLGEGIPRRYSVAGNVLWLAWPEARPTVDLAGLCGRLGRRALAIRGIAEPVRLGEWTPSPFESKLRSVFDPRGIFMAS